MIIEIREFLTYPIFRRYDTIEWSILCETGFAFNPITERCKLCLMEKYLIMFNPADATLNLRSEFFSHCRHKERHLLLKPEH